MCKTLLEGDLCRSRRNSKSLLLLKLKLKVHINPECPPQNTWLASSRFFGECNPFPDLPAFPASVIEIFISGKTVAFLTRREISQFRYQHRMEIQYRRVSVLSWPTRLFQPLSQLLAPECQKKDSDDGMTSTYSRVFPGV